MPHSLSEKHRPRCPQCRRPLQRYGKRRWHCPVCHRTIRLSRRKPGRPEARGITLREAKLFLSGRRTVRDFRQTADRSLGVAHVRVTRGVRELGRSLSYPKLPGKASQESSFLAVADALWLWVQGERVTAYVILVRGLFETEAVPAVVMACRGWESEAGWRAAFDRLPPGIRDHLLSVTVDENGGLLSVVRSLKEYPQDRECSPLLQVCQFHRLADLQRRIGKKCIRRNALAGRTWDLARRLFKTADELERQMIPDLLRYRIAEHSDCPEHLRKAIHAFLQNFEDALIANNYTFLGIPATTGSAEATCKRLRALFRKIRPTSLRKAQAASRLFRKIHPTILCNGKTNQIFGT